jgi:hypothetical protein
LRTASAPALELNEGWDVKVNTKLGKSILVMVTALALAGCLDEGNDDKAAAAADDDVGPVVTPPPATPSPTPANRAPTIQGTPPTSAKVGVVYSFLPSASDPDGDRLTFSIANKPAWASFESATGRLSGTPPEGSNGTFSNVQISVTDGQVSASTPRFDITVAFPTVGSATLAWEAPTQNEDGTPLADLAGYVVRYGRDPSVLDQHASIPNPGITEYVVDDLAEGIWYFNLASVNRAGVESRPTSVVAKTIG